MANYYATWRSNYFRVKDVEAFEKEMSRIEAVKVVEEGDKVVLLPSDFSEDPFPTWYDDETGDSAELDWSDIFKRHLQENSVAIIMEAGNEKLRYVIGVAIAYNHEGDSEQVCLHDIHERIAEAWGSDVEATACEY